MEVGCSTPFAKVVGYRGGEYFFHLFSNTDLEERIFLCSLRRLDSLDFRDHYLLLGEINSFQEGLFEDYFWVGPPRGSLEGEALFFGLFTEVRWKGRLELWVNLEVRKK